MTQTSRIYDENREYAVITYLFIALFIGLIAYFVYFEFTSESFINSPYNKRIDTFSEIRVRGKICASDGTILAQTLTDEAGGETRNYPFGPMYAHIVGYGTNGKSGIESTANYYLLSSHAPIVEQVTDLVKDKKSPGDDVYTTLDTRLQQTAYNALGQYDGAVVVMEPSTGKILAMVSKPDYDPNNIAVEWDNIINSGSSVLVNRATQGLYPPGSTFKIITALEYMRENKDYSTYSFECTGSVSVEDSVINCYNNHVHGVEDLDMAFARSCNSFFSTLGLSLEKRSYNKLAEQLLFNKKLPLSMEYKKSSFNIDDSADVSEIMQTAIGQGNTVVTPMHMAMIVSAIANDGVLMKPYVVDHTQSYNGTVVRAFNEAEYGALMSEDEAHKLQQLMQKVVSEGTATSLSGQNYLAAGKTGSAEFGEVKGDSHAWFVGYASKDSESKADIAVAVLVEKAGAGSAYAVPIAQQIFQTYYQ